LKAVTRNDRRHKSIGAPTDSRTPGEHDHDRVLYSEPFRRLIGVTQVVGSHEGYAFHNRLTHSLKVAQIARRLSERVRRECGTTSLEALGGLDPEVAEAAALAHDIGHPPFGHAGELVLDRLVRQHGCLDGFEGNAQSFRIVSKLAFRQADPDEPPGLDLTRATLRAVLKYPWMRELDCSGGPIPGNKRSTKWGAYETEEADFDFAMELGSDLKSGRSLEAEIMDWADDITYAIHDLEDFYRAGLIPLASLNTNQSFRDDFVAQVAQTIHLENGSQPRPIDVSRLFDRVVVLFPSTEFNATSEQFGLLSALRNTLITVLSDAFSLSQKKGKSPEVNISRNARIQVEILKGLTRRYVIDTPQLAAQQSGHEKVIETVFKAYCSVGEDNVNRRHLQSPLHSRNLNDGSPPARVAADHVASLTEHGILQLYGRITGVLPGSIKDVLL
jgi:dGTPase